MRRTPQRRAILAALEAADGPLTAKEVHERASAAHAGLGLATVYRNLARAVTAGEVAAVHLPQDVVRYEPVGGGHHHHFRCVRCGAVSEYHGSCPVALPEGTTLPGGVKLLGHELTLFGLCAGCATPAVVSART